MQGTKRTSLFQHQQGVTPTGLRSEYRYLSSKPEDKQLKLQNVRQQINKINEYE